jgi:hypothetical protein
MEAARAALEPVDGSGLNARGGLRITAPQVKKALAHDDRAEFGMPADARAKLEAIQDSLQNQGIPENKIGTVGGSDTAANNMLMRTLRNPWAMRLMGGAAGGAMLGGYTGDGYGTGALAGMALGLGEGGAARIGERDIANRMATKAADSQKLLQSLQYARSSPLSPLRRALGYTLPYTALPASSAVGH